MKKGLFYRVFGRLLYREIFKDWAQSLAIVSIGAIATTLFVGLQANTSSMSDRLDRMLALSAPADIYVMTDPRSFVAEDDADSILNLLDENDYLETRFLTYCSLESHNVALACSYSLPTISIPYDVETSEFSTANSFFYVDETIAGDLAAKHPDTAVLGMDVDLSFDLQGFSLDDSYLSILDSFLKQGKKNPFREGSFPFRATISGIMKHPENTTKASPMPMLTLLSNKVFQEAIVNTLQDCFLPIGAQLIYRFGFYEQLGWGDGDIHGSVTNFPKHNQYLIRLQDGTSAKEKKASIESFYKAKAENNLYSTQTLEETNFVSTLRDEIHQARMLSLIFPVVFFLVAVLVIITTLRQNILKRRQEIGTFKALGLTKREIHGHFLFQTGTLVALASLLGAIIGPVLLPSIMAHKYDILYTLPAARYVFPTMAGILSIGAFLLLSLGATFFITRREIALKPVESMRPKTMKMHHGFFKSQKGKQGAVSLSAKMAGRNIIYDPVKALMVVLGITGCTALLVCGFGIDNTLNYDIHVDPYVNSFQDEMAHFLPSQTGEKIELDFSQVVDEEGTPLISSYQPYSRMSLEVLSSDYSYTTYLFVLGKGVGFNGNTSPAHMPSDFPRDEILLSTKAAQRLHVSAGDTVKFYVGSSYVEPKIHAIYEAFYGNSVIMHFDSSLLAHPYDEFQSAWVEGAKEVDSEQLRDRLMGIDYVRMVDTSGEWIRRVEDIVSSISTMTMAIKVFALLLAVVVIYNLGLLNFRERTREIATLKVLGFHTLEISAGLLIETLSMTLLGIVGGLAVGFPFMKVVLMINQIDVIHYIYRIYPLTYLFSALFSFGVALFINLGLTRRIKNVHAVESLKSVE